jgi:S1-C subfamily serine protease
MAMNNALMALNGELTALIKGILPSTVTINGFSKDLSEGSQGSGWIYAANLVVTNHHVIDGMVDPITVRPVGRGPLTGSVIGIDPGNDIALLRVDGLQGTPLLLEELTPQLGELCVAIGTPHSYRESASLGIISGLSRQIRNSDGSVIEEMIQTDASVNPGNSGGPLVNIHGRVLGINTMGPAETVNMAVPAETIAHVVPELLEHGAVLRSSIGISIAVMQLEGENGISQIVTVRKIKEPANHALESGDVLLEINGNPVRRRIDVIRALSRDTIGKTIPVVIERDGEKKIVNVSATKK